jgi:hypothetical protein
MSKAGLPAESRDRISDVTIDLSHLSLASQGRRVINYEKIFSRNFPARTRFRRGMNESTDNYTQIVQSSRAWPWSSM